MNLVRMLKVVGWMFVILGLVMISVRAGLAEPINLTANETFNFTWENMENGSQEFYCSTQDCPDPENKTLSASLFPGENLTISDEYCRADFQCLGEITDDNICSIDRSVDPGDVFVRQSGACDIRVECEEQSTEDLCEQFRLNTTHKKVYRLFEDGNNLVFEFDREQQFSVRKNGTINSEGEVEFKCSTEVQEQDLSGEDLLEVCKTFMPTLSNTVDLLVRQGLDDAEGREQCLVENEDCTVEKGVLNAQINGLSAELNSTISEKIKCEEDLRSERDSKDRLFFFSIIGVIAGGLGGFISLFLGYLLWKQRSVSGGEVEYG